MVTEWTDIYTARDLFYKTVDINGKRATGIEVKTDRHALDKVRLLFGPQTGREPWSVRQLGLYGPVLAAYAVSE